MAHSDRETRELCTAVMQKMEVVRRNGDEKATFETGKDHDEDNRSNDSDNLDLDKVYYWRGKYFDAQDEVKQQKRQVRILQKSLDQHASALDKERLGRERQEAEARRLLTELEDVEKKHGAETNRLKEEHARELARLKTDHEAQLRNKSAEVDHKERKIKKLYEELDVCDQRLKDYKHETSEKRNEIERLKTLTATLRSDVDRAENAQREERRRRKDKHHELCDALDLKDKREKKILELYDDIKGLKDENKALRQKNRDLRAELERSTPRLAYSLVLARCLHQGDPEQLRVAEMLQDCLGRDGDRVDVKIKVLEHVSRGDGILLVIGKLDGIKDTLQRLNLTVPFVLIIVHDRAPDRVTTPCKVGVASNDWHVETIDVVVADGVLSSGDPNPDRSLTAVFRELAKGHFRGQEGVDVGRWVWQASREISRFLTGVRRLIFPRHG